MPSIQLIDRPSDAALLTAPLRRRILDSLAEPASASTLAKTLGVSRQRVAYHVRQLETAGYLRLVRTEQRRGCVERIVQRTAEYLVLSPDVLGGQGLDPRQIKDKFSSRYLIAIASRMAQDVARAQAAAERARRPIATLSADVEVRLRSPKEREAFANELLDAITQLVARYHDERSPDGRSYRLVVGAYPVHAQRRTS